MKLTKFNVKKSSRQALRPRHVQNRRFVVSGQVHQLLLGPEDPAWLAHSQNPCDGGIVLHYNACYRFITTLGNIPLHGHHLLLLGGGSPSSRRRRTGHHGPIMLPEWQKVHRQLHECDAV